MTFFNDEKRKMIEIESADARLGWIEKNARHLKRLQTDYGQELENEVL